MAEQRDVSPTPYLGISSGRYFPTNTSTRTHTLTHVHARRGTGSLAELLYSGGGAYTGSCGEADQLRHWLEEGDGCGDER